MTERRRSGLRWLHSIPNNPNCAGGHPSIAVQSTHTVFLNNERNKCKLYIYLDEGTTYNKRLWHVKISFIVVFSTLLSLLTFVLNFHSAALYSDENFEFRLLTEKANCLISVLGFCCTYCRASGGPLFLTKWLLNINNRPGYIWATRRPYYPGDDLPPPN